MKKTLVFIIVMIASISCTKEVAYCWQCVDLAGNDLYHACDKSEGDAKAEFVGKQAISGQTLTEADFYQYCHKK